MKTALVSQESFKGSNAKIIKKSAPYYLTRPKTPEEQIKIKKELRKAKILMGFAVGGGLAGSIIYFAVKLLKHR